MARDEDGGGNLKVIRGLARCRPERGAVLASRATPLALGQVHFCPACAWSVKGSWNGVPVALMSGLCSMSMAMRAVEQE